MDYPLFIVPLFLLIWMFSIPVTTLIHELGHAIPALIFTDQQVNVYLGSYGDHRHSIKLQLSKRLKIYFKYNVFKWRRGMVQFYSTNISRAQHFIILALGPLMSLILASIVLYITFSFDLHGAVKLCIAIFSFSALIDLRNIYPNPSPIVTDSGSITYCDGYQIVLLFKKNGNYHKLNEAYKFYAEENYEDAIKLFEKLSPDIIDETNVPYIIEACRQLKLYSKAKEFYIIVVTRPANKIPTDVWCQIGLMESLLGEHKMAMEYYNNSLALDEANIDSLNNRAFTYILLEQYVEAIRDFDNVIKIQSNYAYAWANKGHAKIKLDLLDDGLADIKHAIAVNEKEAYAHRALGLYYFEVKEYHKALESFHLAYKLNADTYMLDEEIKMAESKLSAIK